MSEAEEEDGSSKHEEINPIANETQPKEATVENLRKLSKFTLSILVVLLGVSCYIFFIEHPILEGSNDGIEREIMSLFVSYDTNADGRIDPYEFLPIAHRILGEKGASFGGIHAIKETWDPKGEQITVKALFQPLVLTSMTKLQETQYFVSDQALDGLKTWKAVSIPAATFPVNAFSIFLPPPGTKPSEHGKAWYIIEPRLSKFEPQLSSNRFIPPPVHGSARILHRLLSMLHPRPFLWTRFGPQGMAACIRAENEKYLEIQFRLHAEFQLNEPPLYPFWFSPAQFAGSTIISRDGTHIKSFHMAVPTNKSLNVDMEWLLNRPDSSKTDTNASGTGEEKDGDTEVDIGFLPQMEIVSQSQSFMMEDSTQNEKSEVINNAEVEMVQWRNEISRVKAEKILEEQFYPFKKVAYLPFKEAFRTAKAQNKLVHHIVLWGALDDQSC